MYLTVKQTSEQYPAFTQNSLRWIIFNSKSNGATAWLRKIGRKILIDSDGFVSWIDSQKEC
jgi:hypothetical protein